MVKIALDMIDRWMTHYSKARLGDQEVPSPVPRYVDALLLIVNSCTAVIWKPQAAESTADKSAAKEPQVRLNIHPLHKPKWALENNRNRSQWTLSLGLSMIFPALQQLPLGQEVLMADTSTRRQQHSRRTQ